MTPPAAKRLKLSFEMDNSYCKTMQDSNTKKLVVHCTLCSKNCDTYEIFENHSQSKAHIKKLNFANVDKLNPNLSNISINRSDKTNSMFDCMICNVKCNTKEQLDSHSAGKNHIKKALKHQYKSYQSVESPVSMEEIINETCDGQDMETSSVESPIKPPVVPKLILDLLKPLREQFRITCQICNLVTNTEEQYIMHCNGTKHKKKFKSFNVPDELLDGGDICDGDFVKCPQCNIKIHKNNIESHNNGKIHKENVVKSRTDRFDLGLLRKNELSSLLVNAKQLKLEPRLYQKEIYEKSLRTDCVIFLPTGTGKTFIGAMLILKMLEENPFHRVAFLVDKVLLVMQQHDFLKDQFKNITMNRFVTDTEVEHRKLKFLGLANMYVNTDYMCSIRDHDIIVATAELFRNILSKKQFFWTDLSLVMLDEAHHCVKEHPYKRLLQEYHLFPNHIQISKPNELMVELNSDPEVDEEKLIQWKKQRCKIIGLTASPAGDLDEECTYKLLELLLQSLGDVEIVNVTENIEELEQYTSLTNIETKIMKYGPKETELRNVVSQSFVFLLRKFERIVKGIGNNIVINANSTLSIEEVGNLKNQLYGFLNDIQDIQKSIVNHILSLVDIIEAIDCIGYKIAMDKFKDIVDNANEKVWFDNNIFNFADTTKRIFESSSDDEASSVVETIVMETQNIGDENRTILLLVKERKIAHDLQQQLKKECPKFEVCLLVGHGSKGGKNKNKGMNVMKQKKALDFIREKRSQIIVATSVADEGIDLPLCDLVIIVNPPDSVQALVQIRGRARKKSSKLLMLCRDQQAIDSLEELKTKEKNIIQSINKLLNKNKGCV